MGGLGKLRCVFLNASRNIRVSCAVPSQLAHTNVNNISNPHTAIIFCVGQPFLPMYGICLSTGSETRTCVPSIAPIQSY